MTALPITSEDREMLKALFEQSGTIDTYWLHKKYRLSPGQVSRSTRKLEQWNIIEISEERVHLTVSGQQWVFKNRHKIFSRHADKEFWNAPTDRHKGKQIGVNEPYFPNFDKIDRAFFRELERK